MPQLEEEEDERKRKKGLSFNKESKKNMKSSLNYNDGGGRSFDDGQH